ncbi:MAG: UDP-N-acetylmuramate dehydrogenase [Acidimicrobiaceae bacterium]
MSLQSLAIAAGTRLQEHAEFGKKTTYRVGGTVRALLTLSSLEELSELGNEINNVGMPIFVLGNGSNLLVADGEHEVLGIVLQGEFESYSVDEDVDGVVVTSGAGMDLPVLARRLSAEGIVGFEWAVGVPGTIGGACVMNAGGHGSDMATNVIGVTTWSAGALKKWSAEELVFGYRSSALGSSDIVLSASLRLSRGDTEESKKKLSEIVSWRRENQPGGQNAGSVFANPENDHAGRLIEAAGLKGTRKRSAVVSEKHANFIIVDSDGSANDVYELMKFIQDRVFETSGVLLHSEHHFLGLGDLT